MTPSNLAHISMSEDDLTRIKKLVLVKMRSDLVQSLDPRLFLTTFRQEFVLNARECDIIKSSSSRSTCEGAENLLDILETKGSRGYDVLCKALLEDQTQLHLLTALGDTLSQFKHNFLLYREGQIKMAEQQRKEMELTKQYTHLKYSSPLRMEQYVNSELKVHQSPHRARSPMQHMETAQNCNPPHIYSTHCTGHNYMELNDYQAEYYQYQAPHQFVHGSLIQYQQTSPVMPGELMHLPYPHDHYMYQAGIIDTANCHDLPCGQQGN